MTTSTMVIKRKPLSISEKLNIISKADGTPSVRTCSEAMEHLDKYEHFLRSNADAPEHVVQSLWNLKMYTANVFEKRARQTTLDKYFKQK
jgi:DNA-directed RNA polymerase subunit F